MKSINIGDRFGRLTVTVDNKTKNIECRCDCGTIVSKSRYDIVRGFIKSCGCLNKETVIARNKATASRGGATHSYSGKSWNAMMSRCYNEKYHCYSGYGAVGIKVCEFLRASPVNLILLIGERPNKYSIDRINTRGSYTCGQCAECMTNGTPLNVRWANATQQGRNQTTNRLLTINGETKCVTEWAEISGVDQSVIRNRIRRGWPMDKLILPALPVGKRRPAEYK